MPYVKSNKAGTRFTGYFRDRTGRRLSAGTFSSHAEAMDAAASAEQRGSSARGLAELTVQEWAGMWLDSTSDIEPRTVVSYRGTFEHLIIPILGAKRMEEVTPADVYEMVDLLKAQGLSARQILEAKKVLGSSFRPLVDRGLVVKSPTLGVRTPKQSASRIGDRLVTAAEVKLIADALPTDAARLFALFLFVTGLRYGEASEIRVKDLRLEGSNPKIVVERRVVEVGAKRNNGERFLVLPATKSGFNRVLDLPHPTAVSLQRHIAGLSLSSGDLLFGLTTVEVSSEPEPIELGNLWVTDEGVRFQHGTLMSFRRGGCRCVLCGAASTAQHREWKQRAERLPKRARNGNTSDHLPRDVWRRMWRGAIKEAGLTWYPRTHDLRHATASYLLDSTDPVYTVFDVMMILGHRNIKTTQQYLHRVSSKAAPKVFDDMFDHPPLARQGEDAVTSRPPSSGPAPRSTR